MSRLAWFYVCAVLAAGALLCALALPDLPQTDFSWVTWGVLAGLATCTQLFKTLLKNRRQSDLATTSYSPFLVFVFAGVLLLPPSLFVLLVIVPHLVEWAKDRWLRSANLSSWYIQPFNVATHVIAGIGAGWLYNRVLADTSAFFSWSSIVAVVIAALAYTVINHLLIGGAMVLARGVSWRESGCIDLENLLPDFLMLSLGGAVAKLWEVDPWLVLLVLSTLTLIYRALQVPQLKKEAHTDTKTGLLNARRFAELAQGELARARRFDRPMSVIVADLDFLRDVNNTYGHLAGDVVIAGIGQVISHTVRDYDIAGRFGGEEFAIVLPEVEQPQALIFAERLRQAVASASFVVATSPTPIKVTMSLGVSSFPSDGATLDELIHQADVAVYQAKLHGRNRVLGSAQVPHFVRLQGVEPAGANEPDNGVRAVGPASSAEVVPWSHATIENSDASGGGADPSQSAQPQAQVAELGDMPAAQHAVSPQASPKGTQRSYPAGSLGLFVASVIGAGVLAVLASILLDRQFDVTAVLLLLAVAVVGEVLHANYGGNTQSVTVAVIFAGALLSGIPAAALVSLAVALAHYIRVRPHFHVAAFNWAVHVLAACAPVLLIRSWAVTLDMASLLMLAAPTIAAGLLYYAVETGLIARAISLSSRAALMATWRDQFRWALSHYLVLCSMGLLLAVAYTSQDLLGIVVFAAPVLMMRYAQQQYVEHTKASVQELQRLNWELSQANQEVISASNSIRKLNDELFLTLAKILDARDPYVGGHSTQVAKYAAAVAQELGLESDRIALCRQAGFLHDIGKIAISEQILHKPGKLTAVEYEILKAHSVIGAEFLETSHGLRHLAPFVRHHHEYWDGKGYPDGLRREQIPIEARILAVCDAVEAMASDRPYKRARSLEEIVDELRRCSGTQFDPQVAGVFVRLIEREGSRLVVNSALTVDLRQTELHRPVLVEAGRDEKQPVTASAA